MEDDPISSSSSDEELPPSRRPSQTISATPSSSFSAPQPRKKINTRLQTNLYGTLSSGKSKKELLATPRFSTSMKTKEQARKVLIKNALLPLDKDPDLSSLSTALLHLERSISNLTAPGAEAIRAVAIILDSFSLSGSTSLYAKPLVSQAQQTDTTVTKAATPIEEAIEELRTATECNKNSAEMLARAIDEVRRDFHTSAELISTAADKLTNITDRHTEPNPMQDSPSIIGSLQEIKELIKVHPQPQARPTSYKEALTGNRSTTRTLTYPPSDHFKANAAIKERQILLDLDDDHPIKKQCLSREEVLTTFQKAVADIQTPDSPDVTIKALKILANGGILLELPSNDAANWIKQNEPHQKFAQATGGKLTIKDRSFNIVVPFTPIWIVLEEEMTLRNMEKDNELPEGSITSARWIKPPSKREAFQRFAHAMLSLTSPSLANKLIQDGLRYNSLHLKPIKDKKDPLRCLKCQRWGHLAKTCKAEKDTCGQCAGEHRTSSCPSTDPPCCINCDSTSHASASRKCPEFLKRSEELNARKPENLLPYFPTEEAWTQDPLPPPPSGPIVPTRRPTSPSQPPARKMVNKQTTIGNFYTSNRPAGSQPTATPPTPAAPQADKPPAPPTPPPSAQAAPEAPEPSLTPGRTHTCSDTLSNDDKQPDDSPPPNPPQ